MEARRFSLQGVCWSYRAPLAVEAASMILTSPLLKEGSDHLAVSPVDGGTNPNSHFCFSRDILDFGDAIRVLRDIVSVSQHGWCFRISLLVPWRQRPDIPPCTVYANL
ncbi:hypothetical protein HHK36_026787 [Tetracentron sinense]|uniref:Uncharacterized protein n=1 Tax=Tetracentron sinense TaxID=13715 RepID=A0A834YJC9_TETSI|nr:hypothetical protein HHK36_026787 [Tetracentron sinense]